MIYLTKSDVLFINKATTAAHGGNFTPPNNFLHEENLDYLLEAVEAEMFGAPLYPEIANRLENALRSKLNVEACYDSSGNIFQIKLVQP